MSKYKIPEGMAATVAHVIFEKFGNVNDFHPRVPVILEAAITWLSQHPIEPTDQQMRDIFDTPGYSQGWSSHKHYLKEWQRRMFLAPKPEVPESLKDILFYVGSGLHSDCQSGVDEANAVVIEAYRRGQASNLKP